MNKLTVLVDMDSTFVDLLPYWLHDIYKEHGVRATPEEVKTWELRESPALAHLTAQQVYGCLQRPGFFRDAPPMAGALEALWELHQNCDIVVVSSPSGPVSAKEKFEWLGEHLPWLHRNNVMLANRKTLVRGDVLIDDHPDTLVAYKKAWPRALAIGVEYPYNRHLIDDRSQPWLGETPVVFPDYAEPKKAWKSIVEVVKLRAQGVF